MKGIVLAAGRGTRMGAATLGITTYGAAVSKPLIPTYDKPTIYYSIASLIATGIREILIIAAPDNIDQFRNALGDGTELGINLWYTVQPKPRGIAEAFIIGDDFIGDGDVALTFGDNIFSGQRFAETLRNSKKPNGATIFAYHVDKPQEFGVVEFDESGRAISLEEKPKKPRSNFAVPGMYFYSPEVIEIAKQVEPSTRGELEITSVNKEFLRRGGLKVVKLDSDTDWFDTGSPDLTKEAADFVQKYQQKTSRLLGSPEAEAYIAGFISAGQLFKLGTRLEKSNYGRSLLSLASGGWDL